MGRARVRVTRKVTTALKALEASDVQIWSAHEMRTAAYNSVHTTTWLNDTQESWIGGCVDGGRLRA